MADTIEVRIVGKDEASGVVSGVAGKLKGLAGLAGGAAVAGIAGLGAGLLAAGGAGLKFNSDMENVHAQLMGFIKDAPQVEQMLANLKTEAATTPFSFNEMAEAMVSLTPAAKQSGMDVMALIEQAEILAALNPAEGMTGGAFALREALSGDFTSIIERFNLPRQRLNELKEQGVPAVEAINTVLGEMGADISLVDNLSKTLSGRWSTVQDTLMNLAAVATKPIFDQLSAGLGQLGDYLAANEPKITAFSTSVGTTLGNAFTQAGEFIMNTALPALQRFGDWFMADGLPAIQGFSSTIMEVFGTIAAFIQEHGDTIKSILQGAWETISGVVDGALHIISGIIKTVTSIISGDWQGAWDGIKEVVSGAKTVIVTLIGGLKDAIVGIFSAAGSWLLQAGRDLIQGLANGIAGMWGSVVGMAKRLAGAVVSTIKGALQIHSPSKVMAKIGQNTVLGLVAGMDDAQQEAAKKAADVASSIIDALAKALDFSKSASGVDISGTRDSLMGTISSLKFLAEHAVQSLGDTGRYIGTELLDAAKGAGDAMSGVFGALGAGLEFVGDFIDRNIIELEEDLFDNIKFMISDLKFIGEHATQSLADTGRYLGTETLDAAKATSEAFDSAFGALGAGLEFINDFIDRNIIELELDLFDNINFMANDLIAIGQHATKGMGEAAQQLGTDTLDAAKAVGDSFGSVFGALGDGLAFVSDFIDKNIIELELDLFDNIKFLADDLIAIGEHAMTAMAEAAKHFDTEVLAQSKATAEAMGAPFGVLTDALGFSSDVIDFLADNKWPQVSSQLINLLTDLAVRSTQAFAEAAGKFTTDVLDSAKAFADAAKPVFDTIKSVADGFTALQEMGKISESKLGLFEGNIQRVMGLVKKMRSMAESGISDATVFRNLMDQIAAALKVGTETLGGAQAKASGGSSNVIPLTPMARGGIVTKPTPILAGDGGEPEAIIPLSRLGQLAWSPGMGGGQQVMHIHVPFQVGEREFKELVLTVIGRELMFQGAH